MKRVIGRLSFYGAVICVAALPQFSYAQVANFVFTTDPQAVDLNTVSQQITLQAQDSGGASVNIPSTACIAFSSTSAQGQFSSSGTNWSAVSVLTMNKNTANKNFYYKDSQIGTHTLTAKVALKPETVSSACASWPIDEWSVQWTVVQNITVGQGSASTQNASSSASSSSTTSSGQTQTQTTSSSAVSSYVPPPAPTLFADAGADRTLIVGADAEFNARAYNKNKEIVDRVRFMWNFGDGSTAEGPAVLHHFNYPGRYAVILDIAEDKFAAEDIVIVTAEPAKLGFQLLSDGGVQIDNLAGRDLDLSSWLVRAGAASFDALFALPPHSIVLSGSSMRISRATLKFTATSQAELQYPNGVAVLQVGQRSTGTSDIPSSAPAPSAAPRAAPAPATYQTNVSPVFPEEITSDMSAEPITTSDATSASQLASVGRVAGGSLWWWAAAAALALAAIGALTFAQRLGRKEWDIIEEKA